MTGRDAMSERDRAFEEHNTDGFVCTDGRCMFPAEYATWCTRRADDE